MTLDQLKRRPNVVVAMFGNVLCLPIRQSTGKYLLMFDPNTNTLWAYHVVSKNNYPLIQVLDLLRVVTDQRTRQTISLFIQYQKHATSN